MILGIDEVGRGVWAGPLVVGAVVLGDASIEGLTDSKKLSDKKRRELDIIIREQASGYGLGWVTPLEIDEIGLSQALKLATRRAVEQITTPYSEIIIDGTVNFLSGTGKGRYVTTMKKADLLIASVSAASIIAKVARDDYMIEQARLYPNHFFDKHVGYGTEKHRLAIDNFGITPLHRLSVKPVAKLATDLPSFSVRSPQGPRSLLRAVRGAQNPLRQMSPTAIGYDAEEKVSKWLEQQGHQIVARNWKVRMAEIDIVSRLGRVLYFTEVKYRASANHGDGLAAITPAKLKQMMKAAEIFTHQKHLESYERVLAVASVSPAGIESWFVLE